ncbi:polyprenyl-diphosphate synthase, putative [Talaromyces stipitatus ATCC 10500]|uniref:Polyprenyl-diphosphate synthase, putative n=1 Tax=Talaromyces stipitatus (strain ATCC 10500 / CBS 375.48 / QM 6759 / NRRL 1006) TaxID=441959 RepID=B8MPJ9_TALSN|nr:polyprenyl-diphosphate synthase, putative [Talaromyces stipitatus ATCC 10500]EED14438.1 polyprenyl-diphosphate synthase, putative [Talaromyces stipitatus ATCC 10500]
MDLQNSAAALVQRLGEKVEDGHGFGFMSPAIYDTAWVSMIKKTIHNHKIWLFPECFEYVLSHQLSDGGWAMYASEIDAILNTGASLLSLKQHLNNPYQITSYTQEDLSNRIESARNALQKLLDDWDVKSTLHVGFEILVPALLRYLNEEGITFEFSGKELLLEFEKQKLSKFKAQYLYLPIKVSALHSLEAFIGAIEFDKVSHHKVNGSFMASPSSTAAYMIHASKWDDECEEYLRHVISHASGTGSGGVPSAFPSTIFESVWPLSTLLKVGYDLSSFPSIDKIRSYLHDAYVAENGILGFTPFVGADADDTATTILVLGLLNQPVSVDGMLKEFEEENHFKTYSQERNPSFSANCNVLLALLYTPDPSLYCCQIEKAIRFLHKQFTDSELDVRDKWNLSPYYSWMLMTQAITRLTTLQETSKLSILRDDSISADLISLLLRIASTVVRDQKPGGSWGTRASKEETAYAVLILTYVIYLDGVTGSLRNDIKIAIDNGCSFLSERMTESASEWLWVEKVSYRSEVLSEAYILAALKGAADLQEEKANGIPVVHEISTEINNEINGVNGVNSRLEFDGTNGTNGKNGINGIHEGEVTNGVIEINGDFDAAQITNGNMEEHSVTMETNGHDMAHMQFEISPANGHSNEDCVSIHTDDSDSYYQRSQWTIDQEHILLGPFDYLESLPGKNMRSQLIQSFNTWLQVPAESLAIIDKVISMLHTASLLIDDIQDQSLLRRGQPVAHSIFGTAQAMNSGNYVYFLALREIQKLQSPKAITIYVDSLIDLHRGQGMELFWRDSLMCPTEEEYLDMVANKTGGLFCLAIQLMQAEATVKVDFVPLVRLLGIIFQICDDYLNLKSTAYTDNKGLCEDLTEGKFSFPIIHSIRANPGNRQLINILKQKPREDDIKRYALACMESTKSFDYTRDVVKKLKTEALSTIQGLEKQGLAENIGIRKILARMSLEL